MAVLINHYDITTVTLKIISFCPPNNFCFAIEELRCSIRETICHKPESNLRDKTKEISFLKSSKATRKFTTFLVADECENNSTASCDFRLGAKHLQAEH